MVVSSGLFDWQKKRGLLGSSGLTVSIKIKFVIALTYVSKSFVFQIGESEFFFCEVQLTIEIHSDTYTVSFRDLDRR